MTTVTSPLDANNSSEQPSYPHIRAACSSNKPWIAGFWRRVIAFHIDTFILAGIGFLLGAYFESIFVEMGGWARVIGFGIGILYFGLLNSRLNNGQTLGKKLTNIRVVNKSNNTISVSRSMARYSVLSIPFSLNGAPLPFTLIDSVVMYPISLVVFGGMLATLYLIVFNRHTRQSLHDIALKTYVVHTDATPHQPTNIWKPHFYVVGLLFALATAAPDISAHFMQKQPFDDLLATQQAIANEPNVVNAGVMLGNTYVMGQTTTSETRYITANIQINSTELDDRERAKQYAKLVLQNYPQAAQLDTINITFTYGYDTGIWSSWQRYVHQFTVADFYDSTL